MRPPSFSRRFSRADEDAGAREHFEDAALYDFEYRRRRADVTFYRRLAADRAAWGPKGPILDLACGTGRVTVPLLRDGHSVIGLDRSPAMLARAAARIARLPRARRQRALLLRGDLRALPFANRCGLAIAAFHSVQHLVAQGDLLRFLRAARRSLVPDGWIAFDVLALDAAWIGRDPHRRWARTVFRHPVTGGRLVYTTNHVYDARRRALHFKIYYQPIDRRGRARGRERVVRLCHRQLAPDEVEALLARTGFRLIAKFGDFAGSPLDGDSDEHVYVARVEKARISP